MKKNILILQILYKKLKRFQILIKLNNIILFHLKNLSHNNKITPINITKMLNNFNLIWLQTKYNINKKMKHEYH